MCAGAAASLAALITMVVTTGGVHSAVLHQYPAFTAAQWHGVLSELAIKEIGGTDLHRRVAVAGLGEQPGP